MKKAEYDVKGMHCVSCSMGISKLLRKTKGVLDVEVHLSEERIHITFDELLVSDKLIVDTVARLGYKASEAKK